MSTLSAQHWDSKVKIDPYCIEEFYFWENNLNSIKSAIVFLLISHSVSLTPMLALRGVVQLLPLMRIVCVTSFGSLQSALRALLGKNLQPLIFLWSLLGQGSLVKWFIDSQTAARIIEVGSVKLDLHRFAIKIFQFCAEHSIRLKVRWIPPTKTEKTNYIRHLMHFDDWQITQDFFLSLEELWGAYTVDCFADFYIAKLSRFFSRFWNPGASGIDFFAQ